jgi:hypothetical protein
MRASFDETIRDICAIRGLNRKSLNFARYLAADSTQYITGAASRGWGLRAEPDL